jgi:hypothetical protein
LISGENAAATRYEEEGGAVPVSEQYRDTIERESFADGAEIEFKPAGDAEN